MSTIHEDPKTPEESPDPGWISGSCADPWACEAYGPAATVSGALCFFGGELFTRICGSPGECAVRMHDERLRIFDMMQTAAAAGDPVWSEVARHFTSPDQLLGGAE